MKQHTHKHREAEKGTYPIANVSQGNTASPLLDNRPQMLQRKINNTGLPDSLKSGIENLSGHSMDDVKAHYNSSQPAQLNAHAYAQGTNIHLAPGQEKHLPHEAWHVVQQKQGRVKPTLQMKGKVNINDDKGLEKEADLMGGMALQMKVAEVYHIQSSITNGGRKTSDGSGVFQLFAIEEVIAATYTRELKGVLEAYQRFNPQLTATSQINEEQLTSARLLDVRKGERTLRDALTTFFRAIRFDPGSVSLAALVPALQEHFVLWREGILKERGADEAVSARGAQVAGYTKMLDERGPAHRQDALVHAPPLKATLSVAQGWYTIARLHGVDAGLTTAGAGPCVAIGMTDPTAQIVLLAHVDSTTKPEQCVQLIRFLVARMQHHIVAQGLGDGRSVEGYLSGGNTPEAYMELFLPLTQGMQADRAVRIMRLHSTYFGAKNVINQQIGLNARGEKDYSVPHERE